MIVEKLNQISEAKKIAMNEANFETKQSVQEHKVRGYAGELKGSDKTKADQDKRLEVKRAVEKMNKALELFNVERRFVIDDKTKELVIKIIDRETGEVIDQIPPEEVLKRYYEMQKFIGLLFNKRV